MRWITSFREPLAERMRSTICNYSIVIVMIRKRSEISLIRGMNDNHRMIEEPDESKGCAAERAAESLTKSGEVRRKYLWAVRLT